MPTADTNAAVGRYAFESVEGTAPNVEAQVFRPTSIAINPQFETTRSSEILNTLRTRGAIRVGETGMMTLGCEVSFGVLDDFLAAAALSTWVDDEPVAGTDRLRDGVLNPSLTFEVQFTDLTTPSNIFLRIVGAKVQSLAVTLQRDQIAQCTIELMGWEIIGATATAFSGSAARTTTSPYNCIDNLTALNEGGEEINRLEQVSFTMSRALRPKMELGSAKPFQIGRAKLEVTGSLQAHFTGLALFNKMKNFTDSSFDFELTDLAGNKLQAFFPRIQYTDGQPAEIPGEDQDVTGTYNWEATEALDATRQIEFRRIAAAASAS